MAIDPLNHISSAGGLPSAPYNRVNNMPNFDLSQTLIVCLTGMGVAVLVLFVVQLMIMVMSRVAGGKSALPAAPIAQKQADKIILKGVDEKTAAVIMAIVAEQSGVPLEELYFKSIKLEDSP